MNIHLDMYFLHQVLYISFTFSVSARNLYRTISTFAISSIFSGVSLPSSSMSAGRKVPLPFTSSLFAATSDAIVTARTLSRTDTDVHRSRREQLHRNTL